MNEHKTITLDNRSSAFYKGVGAGIEAQEQMTKDGWTGVDIKTRRAIYWFHVGCSFGEHRTDLADQVDAFIQGAAVRQP